jgi:hypothetical protein
MRRIDWTNAKGLRFSWSHGNIKTGRMLTTKTSGNTCPPGCPFLGAGCYAETGPGIRTWRDLTQGSHGVNLADLCARIRAEKPGSLWRHNEAGDLPGIGSRIDGKALRAIVDANHGRKGYTYTHKPLTPTNQRLIAEANRRGFTINLSADSLADADRKAALGIGPVSVVLPMDAPDRGVKTPDGRTVVVCPAERIPGRTCADCGLCQRRGNRAIVGFRAHGVRKRMVSETVSA